MVGAAAVALLTLATSAQADVIFANAGSPVGNSNVSSGILVGSFDSTFIDGSTNSLNSADGTFGLTLDPAAGTNTFRFEFGWHLTGTDARNLTEDQNLVLFLGSVASGLTVAINNITFYETAANSPRPIGTYTFGTAPTITATDANAPFLVSVGALTAANGFNLDLSNVISTSFELTFTGGTAGVNLFEIDAISNPEPGTMALFGLGLMGLGGVILRRRKKRILTESVT